MTELIENLDTVQETDVTLNVNGQTWQGSIPVEETLLDCLRRRVALTGTKRGCESEVCGACTVLVDGVPISSCSYLAFEADGKQVLTVEGLATGEELHPLQAAFARNGAAQCGYCTPGQLMAAYALLQAHADPTYEQMGHFLDGNVCRCGCYPSIATAIREAAAALRTTR
ncbi:MAG TPA: (2Fe-2S)-binding protein [Chloroflexota bacterium]|jgi:aerobic-type carbon monoxide dehydrogenase small subunit (CoxS/CutS family)